MRYLSKKLFEVIFEKDWYYSYDYISKCFNRILMLKENLDDEEIDRYRDIIEYIIDSNFDIDVIIKNKDKYNNSVDLILDYFYSRYNTSKDNKDLINELSYDEKKQVVYNLLKTYNKVDIDFLSGDVYKRNLYFIEEDIVDDLMFMRVLNIDIVNGIFNCSLNKNLRSLVGGPKIVRDRYLCDYCDLVNLDGCPEKVEGFYCNGNKRLKSLICGPKIVKEIYDCSDCDLVSLAGCPEEVGSFFCYNNKNLRSLVGGPKVVRKDYKCYNCGLNNLDGVAKRIGWYLYCLKGNKFNKEYVEMYIKDNGIKLSGKIR